MCPPSPLQGGSEEGSEEGERADVSLTYSHRATAQLADVAKRLLPKIGVKPEGEGGVRGVGG